MVDKDIIDFYTGAPVVYDENSKRIKFCDMPPAFRRHYVTYKDVSFGELKKILEEESNFRGEQ